MIRRRAVFCTLFLTLLLTLPLTQDTARAGELTLVAYNILNFPGSTGNSREPHFRTVLASCQPDILIVQEMLGSNGVNQFLDDILNTMEPGLWAAGPFHDGYDTDNALFIRDECAQVIDSGWLDTDLRDIDWWDLQIDGSEDVFRLFTLHLKASQGSDNEDRRYAECLIMRNHLDTLPEGTHFIVGGDFNIYYDDEPAWQLLRSVGPGQLFDPIEREGYWHNNPNYADIHTQSTRVTQFGGGATGGMDDRFDSIIAGEELLDDEGLDLITETYHAHGQDGDHFNLAIIDGPNGAVPAEVAEALYQASDHLPVVVDINYTEGTAVDEGAPAFLALSAYPNPFNPQTKLRFSLDQAGEIELSIYDLSGRKVESLLGDHRNAGEHELNWRPVGLPSGLYLARLSVDGRPLATSRLVLLK